MPRNRMFMMVGVVLAVVAVIATFVVPKLLSPAQPPPPKFKPVLASQEIPPHSIITPKMISNAKEIDGTRPPDYAATTEEVVGKVSISRIEKDQPLTKENFSATGKAKSNAPFAVAEGERAIAILVNPTSGLGGLVTEGDHVDIVVTYNEDTLSRARTVAQDVVVLATETTITPAPPPVPGNVDAAKAQQQQAQQQQPPKEQIRIVLSVTPEEAEKILAADNKGDLVTVLRNPASTQYIAQLERGSYEPPPQRTATIRPGPQQPVIQVRQPAGPIVFPQGIGAIPGGMMGPIKQAGVDVTVIRGGTRDTENVPQHR